MEDEFIPAIPERRQRSNKKKDTVFEFLLVQIAVCIAALLVAFCLKFLGGEPYHKSRDKYIRMMNDPTNVSQVIETVAGAFKLTEVPSGTSSGDAVSNDHGVSSQDASEGETSGAPNSQAPSAASGGDSSGGTAESSGGASSDNANSAKGGEEEDDTAFVFDFDAVQQQLAASKTRTNTMIIPVSGTVTSGYGYRDDPFTGVNTMHAGLDIAAPTGTDIVSALDGRVKTVSTSKSYGNYIIVSHGNGLETLYAHCSKVTAAEGSLLTKGALIAKVGSTGRSTGPHCHFEVRINHIRMNPQWVLPQAKVV